MTRKTVTVVTSDHPHPRHFHLEESKAERFAAKIRAEGGTATISSLTLGRDLRDVLSRAGVNPASIR